MCNGRSGRRPEDGSWARRQRNCSSWVALIVCKERGYSTEVCGEGVGGLRGFGILGSSLSGVAGLLWKRERGVSECVTKFGRYGLSVVACGGQEALLAGRRRSVFFLGF